MTPNPNGLIGDHHTRVVIPMMDQAMWRRTGAAQPDVHRCPHADDDLCDCPAFGCRHLQAAEACTEVGAEVGAEVAPNWLARIADAIDRRTFWTGYLAALLVGIGRGLAHLLPMVTR